MSSSVPATVGFFVRREGSANGREQTSRPVDLSLPG
jgi:hypothetical protein